MKQPKTSIGVCTKCQPKCWPDFRRSMRPESESRRVSGRHDLTNADLTGAQAKHRTTNETTTETKETHAQDRERKIISRGSLHLD